MILRPGGNYRANKGDSNDKNFEDYQQAWVEQQLGVTPDRTAELEQELAVALNSLDIVHAQGVASGKDIGRKELEGAYTLACTELAKTLCPAETGPPS